MRLFLKFIDV